MDNPSHSDDPEPYVEELMRTALRRARRDRFLETDFIGPLRRFLAAVAAEANLSAFGRHAAHFDVLRGLENQLIFDAAESKDPTIRQRPISRPIFITGLPRSSSTFLHLLLAQDPNNSVPRCWELIYPYPAARRILPFDFRRLRVAIELRIFQMLSPGLAGLHPFAADMPQECTDITANVFQSYRFETIYRIPSYQAWLDAQDHCAAFRFHKRFLQHLDSGRQWILKCPDDVFSLDAIKAVYPDARFVFLHRDPLSVVASCAQLTESLRRPFTTQLDRRDVGQQVASRLVQSSLEMIAAKGRKDAGDILHLHYDRVVNDPLQAVREIYRHCALELSDAAEQRMRAYVRSAENAKMQPRIRMRVSDFGIDPEALRRQFAPYMEAFRVADAAESLPNGTLVAL